MDDTESLLVKQGILPLFQPWPSFATRPSPLFLSLVDLDRLLLPKVNCLFVRCVVSKLAFMLQQTLQISKSIETIEIHNLDSTFNFRQSIKFGFCTWLCETAISCDVFQLFVFTWFMIRKKISSSLQKTKKNFCLTKLHLRTFGKLKNRRRHCFCYLHTFVVCYGSSPWFMPRGSNF